MTDLLEPPAKKAKMEDTTTIDNIINDIVNSKNNLEPVLSDDYYQPVPLIKVYVGRVKNAKDISKMFQILNEKVPLKELHHLKRVRRKDILLCPKHYLNSMVQESIQEYIEHHVSDLKYCFDYFKDVDVPLNPPLTRQQYLECSKQWSVNFHPDKYLERLLSDEFFGISELSDHRQAMAITFEVAKWYAKERNVGIDITSSDFNAAVVVDTRFRSVVAVAFDNRREHPVQHAAMLAIDNVAKTQNGGAWSTCAGNVTLAGIDKELLIHLQSTFKSVKFGAREFVSKNNGGSETGPYLCTGYDVYLMKEPCIMCSMGLVHARAKRIFFCYDNETNGALKSKTKLQCLQSLNHHFEVFTKFL